MAEERVGGIFIDASVDLASLERSLAQAQRRLEEFVQKQKVVVPATARRAAATWEAAHAAPAPFAEPARPTRRRPAQQTQEAAVAARASSADFAPLISSLQKLTHQIEVLTSALQKASVRGREAAQPPATAVPPEVAVQTQAIRATRRRTAQAPASVSPEERKRQDILYRYHTRSRVEPLTLTPEELALIGLSPEAEEAEPPAITRPPEEARLERERIEAEIAEEQRRERARSRAARTLGPDIMQVRLMYRQIADQQKAAMALEFEQQRIAADAASRAQQILSQAATAARTPRTLASALGGLFFGPRGAELEAEARLAAAKRQVGAAMAQQMVYERQIIANAHQINRLRHEASIYEEAGKQKRAQELRLAAQALEEWNAEIKGSKEYRESIQGTTRALEQQAKATQELESFGLRATTAIRGLASVTIAGSAFAVGMKALDMLVGSITPALADAMDRLTGYQTLTNRVTQALGSQTREMRGNSQAAINLAAAQAGVSSATADYLQKTLDMNVRVKAANQAVAEMSSLFRSTMGQVQGLTGGYGGLFGTAILGSELGGGKGLSEQIAADLAVLSNLRTMSSRARVTTYEITQSFEEYIKTLNDSLGRGADALGASARASIEFSNNAEEINQSAQAAAAAGDQQLSAALKAYGLVVKINGRIVRDAQEYQKIFQRLLVYGLSTPDIATELQAQRGPLRATRFLQQMMLGLTQQQIGRQFGMQVGLGPQFMGDQTRPLRALGVSNVQPVADLYRSIRADADAALRSSIQFVRSALTDMPSSADDYAAALTRASSYARQISEIDLGLQTKQAALAASQYAFNLFVAKRSLADAQGLAGRLTGANKDNLGVIERQNWLLGRQLQMLGFELTQRQINFRRALAGFQVPGLTPEEQAARVEQAQIEADFAQKQLDLQRQIFSLQGRSFTISASRQVQDLVRQIGLLKQGWQLQIDTAMAEKQIQALSTLLNREQSRADAIYSVAVDRIQTIYRTAAESISRYANATMAQMLQFAQTVAQAWGIALGGMTIPSIGGGGGLRPRLRQHGALLRTSGPTVLPGNNIAGEAGSEFVAILRNPRPFSGANSITVNVTINGSPNLSRDQLESWAREIGDLVETRIARRGAMLGFRAP